MEKNIGGKGYVKQNRNRENMTKAQTSAREKFSRRVLSVPVWQKKHAEGKKEYYAGCNMDHRNLNNRSQNKNGSRAVGVKNLRKLSYLVFLLKN